MNTQNIKNVKNKILPILKRRGITKAGIFGSFARGDTKKTSDIDLLVKFKREKSLMDLVRLKFELEEKLKKEIDLLTYDSLHPLLRNIILKEEKIIYEKKS